LRITTESVHRSLAYVAAVSGQGYQLSVEEFNSYVQATQTAGHYGGLISVMASLGHPGLRERAPTNPQVVRWIAEDPPGYVSLTPLGRAVLRALDQEELGEDTPLDVVLDTEDRFAYAQIIHRIAQYEEPMLVDAYFKLDYLLHVVQQTSTARVLIGPKADVAGLTAALSSLPPDRKLEIRISDEFHDRYVIPSGGSIDMLGTSLSGVGKKPTALVRVNPPVADEIRRTHEELWMRAQPLEMPEPSGDTA
jgi:hypothetical protein